MLKQIPNVLTTLRLLLAIPLCWMILEREYELVLWVALAAGVSDGLDGWLARMLDATSRYGAVVDPLADKVMLSGAYPCMAVVGLIPWWLALLVIGRDVAIVLGALAYHALFGRYDMEPSQLGKFSTLLQIVLALALLAREVWPQLPALLVDGLFVGVVAITALSGAHYVQVWGSRAVKQGRED